MVERGHLTLFFSLLAIIGRGIVVIDVKIDNKQFARYIVTSLSFLILYEMRSSLRT
jgi:hypothetical protein